MLLLTIILLLKDIVVEERRIIHKGREPINLFILWKEKKDKAKRKQKRKTGKIKGLCKNAVRRIIRKENDYPTFSAGKQRRTEKPENETNKIIIQMTTA